MSLGFRNARTPEFSLDPDDPIDTLANCDASLPAAAAFSQAWLEVTRASIRCDAPASVGDSKLVETVLCLEAEVVAGADMGSLVAIEIRRLVGACDRPKTDRTDRKKEPTRIGAMEKRL